MHFPSDIMSQLMHPPRRHFVPLSQFESPYLGQSLRRISGISWIYLGQFLAISLAYIEENHCSTGIFGWQIPIRQIVPATKCPISSLATKCPTDAPIKTIVSLAFFRRQIVPRRQNVPLSPQRQNVPTYALMHRKVMESDKDILLVVPLCQFEGCAFSEHVLNIFWLHSDSILSFLSFFYILAANSNVIMSPGRKIPH